MTTSHGNPGTGEIVVLSGPPGAGKTTVARKLADELLPSPSVHLHTDDFYSFLRQGAISPLEPESARQNEVVVGVIAQAAAGYAAGGYHVVVDGVVGPWFIDAFRDPARAAGAPLHYAVLRPDESTTLERRTSRPDHLLTDPEPLRAMHAQFRDLGPYEEHALDTTGLSPEATADAVREALAAGDLRLSDAV